MLLWANRRGGLGGGRTEGRGQQGGQSPNTCTWSLDSHSDTFKLPLTEPHPGSRLAPSRRKLFFSFYFGKEVEQAFRDQLPSANSD